MRLLLLEDDRRLRTAYAHRLRADGGAVDEVGSLADAQRALARVDFDCLVLDRLVPDGDAVSLVRDIDRRTDRHPVLMISALGDVADRVGTLATGADDYMVKPFTGAHLDARIATVLRRVAEDADFRAAEFNRAFVLMQYFGYLRRDPDASPDTSFEGYNFWLTKLNDAGGDYRKAELVKAFLTSIEYRQRFRQ